MNEPKLPSEREAYVVRKNGGYVGKRRFSYRDGTHRVVTSFRSADIFNQKSAAVQVARHEGGDVVVLTVTEPSN